jgi:hypothetical protein
LDALATTRAVIVAAAVAHAFGDQLVFRVEVPVEPSMCEPCGLHEISQPRRGDAVLAEFGCRGCNDSLACFRGLFVLTSSSFRASQRHEDLADSDYS